ncbi:MAG: hypothetical protein AAF645_02535 [Myxococcota bacterium]
MRRFDHAPERRAPRRIMGLLLAFIAACGGPVHEEHEGTLDVGDHQQRADGSFQDPYTFRTRAGYQIELVMRSSELRPYLLLASPDGEKLAETNDGPPDVSEVRLELIAPMDGVYTVLANTRAPGETGAYSLTIDASEVQEDESE